MRMQHRLDTGAAKRGCRLSGTHLSFCNTPRPSCICTARVSAAFSMTECMYIWRTRHPRHTVSAWDADSQSCFACSCGALHARERHCWTLCGPLEQSPEQRAAKLVLQCAPPAASTGRCTRGRSEAQPGLHKCARSLGLQLTSRLAEHCQCCTVLNSISTHHESCENAGPESPRDGVQQVDLCGLGAFVCLTALVSGSANHDKVVQVPAGHLAACVASKHAICGPHLRFSAALVVPGTAVPE